MVVFLLNFLSSVARNLYVSTKGFCASMISDCDDMDWSQFHDCVVEVLTELESVSIDDMPDLKAALKILGDKCDSFVKEITDRNMNNF